MLRRLTTTCHLVLLVQLSACGVERDGTGPSGSEVESGRPEVAHSAMPLPEAFGPDLDRDGFSGALDCDDRDPMVYALASEECDGKDNDCDGAVDEGCVDPPGMQPVIRPCEDRDEDGACDGQYAPLAGDLDRDGVTGVDDCDEQDPMVNAHVSEECDGKDNDCDGAVDEGCVDPPGMRPADRPCEDRDKDSVCDPPLPGDLDGDGLTGADDCDEEDPDVNIGIGEVCADGIDNDCDGVVDEAHCR